MDVREHLSLGNGGWVRYLSGDGAATYLRFRDDGSGRLVATELYTAPEQGLSSTFLRRLPLGRIEAWINSPEVREPWRRYMCLPGPDLRTAAAFYTETFSSRAEPHWVARMLWAQIEGSGERQPDPPNERPHKKRSRRARARLPVPESRAYPDSFYQEVAEAYLDLAASSDRPAAELAEANNVPVTTVHRWVKEARRRGFLTTGRRGVAG